MNTLGIKSNGVTGIDFGATSVKACIRMQHGPEDIKPYGNETLFSELSIGNSGVRVGNYRNSFNISNIKEELGKVDSDRFLLR